MSYLAQYTKNELIKVLLECCVYECGLLVLKYQAECLYNYLIQKYVIIFFVYFFHASSVEPRLCW